MILILYVLNRYLYTKKLLYAAFLLKVLASLTTYRIEFEYENGIVSLDENYYGENNEIKDYELEFSSTSMEKAMEYTKQLLSEAKIKFRKFNTHSKQTRAIAAITK